MCLVKVLSTQMSPSSRDTIILDGVPSEDVSSFKCLGASFTATGQAVDEIAGRISLARATFNRLHTSLWLRCEISHRTKGRIYESVVRTIMLYGCETWPLRVEDQRRLEVFDSDCLRRILGYRRQDRIPCVALRHRLHLRALPPVLLQRRLRWFGHAARRPASKIIREVINPESSAHWRNKRGGQLKTWMTTLKEDLLRLSGPDVFALRRWNRDWMTIGIAWAQDRRAWAAAVRDAVVAMDAGATAPR